MSVMMSDMKATVKTPVRRAVKPVAEKREYFTVRDMNRQPRAVLDAARAAGGVYIRTRSGERFLLRLDQEQPRTPESAVPGHLERLQMLRERLQADGQGFSAEGWKTFSKILAGE